VAFDNFFAQSQPNIGPEVFASGVQALKNHPETKIIHRGYPVTPESAIPPDYFLR
jgi:hypothetical protein